MATLSKYHSLWKQCNANVYSFIYSINIIKYLLNSLEMIACLKLGYVFGVNNAILWLCFEVIRKQKRCPVHNNSYFIHILYLNATQTHLQSVKISQF